MSHTKNARALGLAVLGTVLLAGCAGIAEKTNTLSDEKVLSQSAGALGYAPNELKLVSRRTEGTNTYAQLVGIKDKKEYTCIINGGNALSFGTTNPPTCGRKGEPVNNRPFR